MKRQLLLGAGRHHDKRMGVDGDDQWGDLVTLDSDPSTGANVIHDLDDLPYFHFVGGEFDEIHAYEVLEHCGRQGDWRFFFAQWEDFHRITKPGGLFVGSCPHHASPWAWGDPSHSRIIGLECLTFLSQRAYAENLGKTAMSDFRGIYKADWELVHQSLTANLIQTFVLRAVK